MLWAIQASEGLAGTITTTLPISRGLSDISALVTGEPRIRFYAGYPLTLPNSTRVGTLCLIDVRPRELSAAQVDIMRDLGSMVEQELCIA